MSSNHWELFEKSFLVENLLYWTHKLNFWRVYESCPDQCYVVDSSSCWYSICQLIKLKCVHNNGWTRGKNMKKENCSVIEPTISQFEAQFSTTWASFYGFLFKVIFFCSQDRSKKISFIFKTGRSFLFSHKTRLFFVAAFESFPCIKRIVYGKFCRHELFISRDLCPSPAATFL